MEVGSVDPRFEVGLLSSTEMTASNIGDESGSLPIAVPSHRVSGGSLVAGVVGRHPLVLPPPDLLHLQGLRP